MRLLSKLHSPFGLHQCSPAQQLLRLYFHASPRKKAEEPKTDKERAKLGLPLREPWFETKPFEEKRKNLILRLKDVLKAQPNQKIEVGDLGQMREELDIIRNGKPRKIATYVRRFPPAFYLRTVYTHSGYKKTWCGFSAEAQKLIEEETQILQACEPELVRKLRKVLMISMKNRLPLDTINLVRESLGLPFDFRESLVSKYPNFFCVKERKGRLYLELTAWDETLAVSALERNAQMQQGGKTLKKGKKQGRKTLAVSALEREAHEQESLTREGHEQETLTREGHEQETVTRECHELTSEGHEQETLTRECHEPETATREGHEQENLTREGHEQETLTWEDHEQETLTLSDPESEGHQLETLAVSDIKSEGHQQETLAVSHLEAEIYQQETLSVSDLESKAHQQETLVTHQQKTLALSDLDAVTHQEETLALSNLETEDHQHETLDLFEDHQHETLALSDPGSKTHHQETLTVCDLKAEVHDHEIVAFSDLETEANEHEPLAFSDLETEDQHQESLTENTLAVSAFARKAQQQETLASITISDTLVDEVKAYQSDTGRLGGSHENSTCLRFPWKYKKGLKPRKNRGDEIEAFQSAQYIPPYKNSRDLQLPLNSLAAEKFAVAVLHEFLSLTLERRATLQQLEQLRKAYRLPDHLLDFLLRYDGIFYVVRGVTKSHLFLKEAYKESCLVEKGPLVLWQQRFVELALSSQQSDTSEDHKGTGKKEAVLKGYYAYKGLKGYFGNEGCKIRA